MNVHIGPIQFRKVPRRLSKHFDEFAETLSVRIQKEFGLAEKPHVEAKSYADGGRVDALLHAPLVGRDYGRLVHVVTSSMFEFAEDKGELIPEIFPA